MQDIHGNDRSGSYAGSKPFTPAGKHPAKFNDALIPVIAAAINGRARVLDPMAGTGKIATVKDYGFCGQVFCNDIEDWGAARVYNQLVDNWTFCDAAKLPYPDGFFDAIATSPTYGNGINQNRPAVPWYRVITYRAYFGKPLTEGNTGSVKWGKTYRDMHLRIYAEMKRVLSRDGVLVVNMADFVKSAEIVKVSEWHAQALAQCGFEMVGHEEVACKKMRFGSNGHKRVGHEVVMTFRPEVEPLDSRTKL